MRIASPCWQSGNEPIWLSLAKGKVEINDAPFTAAGGVGARGTRTIATNWKYVDIQWLVKVRLNTPCLRTFLTPSAGALTEQVFDSQVKTDTEGNVHYEAWTQPHDERTRLLNDEPRIAPRDVLTKPKILPVAIKWLRIESAQGTRRPVRYVLKAADYQRLLDAVKVA